MLRKLFFAGIFCNSFCFICHHLGRIAGRILQNQNFDFPHVRFRAVFSNFLKQVAFKPGERHKDCTQIRGVHCCNVLFAGGDLIVRVGAGAA